MKLSSRISLFIRGWRYRSAPALGAAGCPLWLQRQRCPRLKGWGTILRRLGTPLLYPLGLPDWGIKAEEIQKRIDELREAGEGERDEQLD
jgi:hypothetical protein